MAGAKKLGPGRHLSAYKRQRQTKKRTLRNRAAKSRMRTAIKKVRTDKQPETLKQTVSLVASYASKGIIPKRRAARIASRLSRLVNAAS